MNRERQKNLHVRLTENERDVLTELAHQYRMDTSTFIRSMIEFVDEVRPRLVVVPSQNGRSKGND